ncbi:MAG: HD domain-containing protein [Desulfobulbaceae bacterium]|uniref:HD domain-containing protein n=1 Tax=Candidatus Desulfatifera sulfidica TaxID=2841691 RepID=A0A8J6TA32_9BACT|nr:HD domain-containing protein [Candidatus Desulfatifera sulfidica]
MKEERGAEARAASFREALGNYPLSLIAALLAVSEHIGRELFVVGGTVRDWLLGRPPGDLDLTVSTGATKCCQLLRAQLGGGTYVPLGRDEEDAGRVVWRGVVVDFSSYRLGASTISADMELRDYTVNAMALSLDALVDPAACPRLIDPMNGLNDLASKTLRSCPGAFTADPLRLLRGFRLAATLGFVLESATLEKICHHARGLARVSVERIDAEMEQIILSGQAAVTVEALAASGLLRQVLPELVQGIGMQQPGCHHLDVFDHSLAVLAHMEEILADPSVYYPGHDLYFQEYLAHGNVVSRLLWAALLHDLGKPPTFRIRVERDSRVTFYGHEQEGERMIHALGRRLRWSNEQRRGVARQVAMHMHPFHLCNVRRQGPLSRKACLNLVRRAGDELPGLFLLAMADSLAGQGVERPPDLEAELVQLLDQVLEVYEQTLKPVLSGPRLLTGADLIHEFSLTPGPMFAEILNGLELARIEGEVADRSEALAWVGGYLRKLGMG